MVCLGASSTAVLVKHQQSQGAPPNAARPVDDQVILLVSPGLTVCRRLYLTRSRRTEMSSTQDEAAPITWFEREKWEAEKAFREREISSKEREQANKEAELDLKKEEQAASRWRNPLIVAIMAAAIAAAGNAGITFINGVLQRNLEAQKSEQTRILEMIKIANPDKGAENLDFLLRTGLISDRNIQEKLSEYLKNRKPGSGPTLPPSEVQELSNKQAKAIELLEAGKVDAARSQNEQNLQAVDTLLRRFPDKADVYALKGYILKDMYQSSKSLSSTEQRKASLQDARKSFEKALQLDPANAGAHNGMGNVLFFEGQFDAALKEHDTALQLTNGNYPAAEHDKSLVIRVKNGEIPFAF
jgi:tetratricopeptide (TPR) repeat protein